MRDEKPTAIIANNMPKLIVEGKRDWNKNNTIWK